MRDIGVDILPICSKVYNLSFSLKEGDFAAFHAVAKTKPQLLRKLKTVLFLELIVADEVKLHETLRAL